MPTSLHQRQQQQKPSGDAFPLSPRSSSLNYAFHHRTYSLFGRSGLLLLLLSLILLFCVFIPLIRPITPFLFSSPSSLSYWRDYTLAQAVTFVGGKNGTIIVCAVSQPYLPFLQNWLISISRQNHQDEVLIIAEDYATLYTVNQRWPGHAVLVPPVPDSRIAHKFGSQGFFNFTSRRPRHLLDILELGYNVMYNDVDMVWLSDPFPYLEGHHDIYFTDDMAVVKPLNHSHGLPQPGKKGRTYICSCMIFLRPTDGAKAVLRKWIEELRLQPWSKKSRSNDQPAFNWALNKTSFQVDLYLLPQFAFPSGGLYFKNETWVKATQGKHVIIHNNYITGFDKKIKRFHDYGLWLVDNYAHVSPLGRI
ncbi:UDP-D-xylose:L-fucose alpha-1,3-D-xylosyltransferase MGP4-like [Phalaenopsis equestris]|uniref:UDP-D-xylose:L-fucose alpha-1,3-D-xylosyltransferase MGP4-like n=1 Tax=Phalaenopsis equestris TaxID=78828 RepID=UPI0009E5CA60|nr:UDP-D-xylose:L-fucose alpha-1,3-D-xylosyltransferase MGP4-like [Phalaenopsis equestris]